MSRKLQSQIQDIKGLPGRFKRILLAWASFANNDGTSIFPAKDTVAERAGVSRWTVYDNTDILEAADVLQRAGSHTCRNERCNKGGTHWTSRHGHYTAVYKINVALLGNPTLLLQKIAEATVAKSNSGTVGKIQPGTVGKPDATQALKETPAPLGNPDSSVLTDGVSEKASEAAADFVGDVALTEEKQDQDPLTPIERKLLGAIMSVWSTLKEPEYKPALASILSLCEAMEVDAADLLLYNRAHKKGALYIKTPEQFLSALQGSGDYALVNEYIGHDFALCKACRDTSRGKKCKGYAPLKAERDERRAVEAKRRWLADNDGWDFSVPSREAGERFYALIRAGKAERGIARWLPDDFNLNAALTGKDSRFYHAAVNRVLSGGAYVGFGDFEDMTLTAKKYDALSKEVEAYDLAPVGRGFDTEEA